MPSWKHRRRLIYLSFFLSVGMIVFGAFTWQSDTGVAQQLIVGGVALISILLTAYTAFATFEDTRHWKDDDDV
jgi:polyferredoxin